MLHDYIYLYFIQLVYVQYTPNVNKSETRPSRLTDQTKPMLLPFGLYHPRFIKLQRKIRREAKQGFRYFQSQSLNHNEAYSSCHECVQ